MLKEEVWKSKNIFLGRAFAIFLLLLSLGLTFELWVQALLLIHQINQKLVIVRSKHQSYAWISMNFLYTFFTKIFLIWFVLFWHFFGVFHKECNSSVWGTHSNFKSIIACSALSARCLMVNSIGDINIRVGGWYWMLNSDFCGQPRILHNKKFVPTTLGK